MSIIVTLLSFPSKTSQLRRKGWLKVLIRVWYILYYHRTSYSYLTLEGRGELLDGGGEKRRSD